MDNIENKDKNKIVKRNLLNEARFNLTLFEYRIILTALSKIKKTDMDFYDIEFSVAEFSNIYNNKDPYRNLYSIINTACRNLASRTIQIETDDKVLTFQWVSKILYIKNQAKIIITFHEELKPYILFFLIDQEYTKYIFKYVTKFKNIFSIRIYELLKQYESIGCRKFTIPELKKTIGIHDGQYAIYSNFKNRVIEKARDELMNYSDIYFTYTEIKDFKKIIGINFNIHSTKEIKPVYKEFIKYEKFELIEILSKLTAEYLATRLYTSILMNLHRVILIDIILFMRSSQNWGEIIYPKSFLESKIKQISELYDIEKIEDY